jgi:putative acetyltransferase
LSLLVLKDGAEIGHLEFTASRLDGASEASPLSILAPLAVIPHAQRRGVGRLLIEAGAAALAADGVAGVFVPGDPVYYGRHGFVPAVPLGRPTPHPTTSEYPDAWRVRALQAGALDRLRATIRCAAALDHPEYLGEE